MDIAPSGNVAVILTYSGLHWFDRGANESWYEALQRAPRSVNLHGVKEAEAVAFSADGSAVFVTTEKPHAPLLRYYRE